MSKLLSIGSVLLPDCGKISKIDEVLFGEWRLSVMWWKKYINVVEWVNIILARQIKDISVRFVGVLSLQRVFHCVFTWKFHSIHPSCWLNCNNIRIFCVVWIKYDYCLFGIASTDYFPKKVWIISREYSSR